LRKEKGRKEKDAFRSHEKALAKLAMGPWEKEKKGKEDLLW